MSLSSSTNLYPTSVYLFKENNGNTRKGVKYVPSVNFEQVNLVGKTVSHNPFKNSANI